MPHEMWSFIEMQDGKYHDTGRKMAAEAGRTAKIFDLEPCGIIFGNTECPNNIEELEWYGLKKLYCFYGCDAFTPEKIAAVLHQAASSHFPEFIQFADTPTGAEIAARLAAIMEKGLITGCTDFEIEGETKLARKPVYKGRMDVLATWATPPPHLATIQTVALEDIKETQRNKPEVITQKVEETPGHVNMIKKWDVSLTELDIAEARVVIGVGKGVSSEFMETVKRLAGLMRAVIGGTRIAVFAGLVPTKNLIGTTGKWLNSELYIAMGISGAPQHLMGIKEVQEVIAINLSKDAPILNYAKLGIVGDLYEIIPRLVSFVEGNGGA
jgi:electron transfer flavoprotein alpha subunit